MMYKSVKHFDVLIIGGGASGLFCATMLKKNNPTVSVAIIEKQKTVGKKLLATGNGRCNLTNLNASMNAYHGTFKKHIDDLLAEFSPQKLINIFKELGLLTTIDSEGRVYPLSKHSSSVLDILSLACKTYNVQIFTEAFVSKIIKNSIFSVITNDCEITCERLIISTGSKATPETGADDTMLSILQSLGHTATNLSPALCPVPVNSKVLFNLKGIRVNGKASILSEGIVLKSESGEIQFTDKALSGICLFNLSRIANTTDSAYISIDLLPEMTKDDVFGILQINKTRLSDASSAEELLCGIFQKKLSSTLLLSAGIKKDTALKHIGNKEINNLASIIKDWCFEVKKSDDFTRAQVVAGGIIADEINHNTMESKKIKNMYLIGEIIDCDGDCGGFNLHFAFATAYRAAKSIAI
ncbi:MAG: aminoacetone oxidase family FAD-binding enzyme [Ruminococcaceae bacterium]|nr:aminoacetone oxidase family FAD-binding enzyme [Oscillospiraceae bacterium]